VSGRSQVNPSVVQAQVLAHTQCAFPLLLLLSVGRTRGFDVSQVERHGWQRLAHSVEANHLELDILREQTEHVCHATTPQNKDGMDSKPKAHIYKT